MFADTAAPEHANARQGPHQLGTQLVRARKVLPPRECLRPADRKDVFPRGRVEAADRHVRVRVSAAVSLAR